MFSSRKSPLPSFIAFALGVAIVWLTGAPLVAQDAEKAKSLDLANRVFWTTSRVRGSADPPDPYTPQIAFPKLKFDQPLGMNWIPGTNRFILAERFGKLYTFEDNRSAEAELFLDLERETFGIAMHPTFLENGYVFVTTVYEFDGKKITRVSRFETKTNDRLHSDLATEKVIFEWTHGGHNGGVLRFGNDGYLYLSTGDQSAWSDWNLTGQRIDDHLACMLRFDVDLPSEGRAYSIPPDNPFIGAKDPNTGKDAKPEIYSYGHRNPWQFSFDREGHLFVGDVGQDLFEMIEVVEKGGNYGWSINEGRHPYMPERPKGPTPILPPLVEHPHSDFRSITGGFVSYATESKDLYGHYIYGDYDTGKIWGLKLVDGLAAQHRQLADTQFRIATFGQSGSGRVVFADFSDGRIYELIPAPLPASAEPQFPRKLSETGIFKSTKDHIVADGVMPYDVNSPLWSDGATKERFIGLPGNGQIEFDTVSYPIASVPGWRFPDNTVLVKSFSIEMETGNSNSTKRLETRLLHHKRMPGGHDDPNGTQVWNGYTYVWNDEQTDAELLEAGGLDKQLTILDSKALGGNRQQVWHFPSRAECALCHTMSAKYALGVFTAQMNRDYEYSHGESINQLKQFERWGVFTKPLPKEPSELPKLDDPMKVSGSAVDRARSYLHANCSHCHRIFGGGIVDIELLWNSPIEKTSIVNANPKRGYFGILDGKLIAPSEPDRSVLLYRMEHLGTGHMPHVASNMVDQFGAAVIRQWILEMKKVK